MNWILAILGIPLGMLLLAIGLKIVGALRLEASRIAGLVAAAPVIMFCVVVLVAKIFLHLNLLEIIMGLLAVSLTATIFIFTLRRAYEHEEGEK